MKTNPSIASDDQVSDGQVETCVTLVTDATRKATGTALRELIKNGVLNKKNIERVRAQGDKVVADITALVKQKFAELAENIAGCLKLISGAETLELEPTNGKRTIAKASDLFTGWLDGDFKSWGLDVKAEPTKAQKVHVHEMIKDGTFAQIFRGLSDNLDELCLTQDQIIQFVENHRKWLRTDGYATFFLFKVGDEFFVAGVDVDDGGLEVDADRFDYDYVWDAIYQHRVVVPQLALAN